MHERSDNLKKRAYEIDLLRGIAVIMMMFDHLMNDIGDLMPFLFSDFPRSGTFWFNLVSLADNYWHWDVRMAFHYVFCFVFLGLTGVCCSFSRNNLFRGLKLSLVAIVLTVLTYFAGKITGDRNFTITFGVLHCIALTLIAVGLLEKFCDNKWVYLIIGAIMVAVGTYFELTGSSVSYASASLPTWQRFVENLKIVACEIIGIKLAGEDCFPWLFNGGQVFIGVFLGKRFYKEKKSLFGWEYKNNAVSFCGRYSLFVYLAHQVIIPVILALILIICGYRLQI